MTDIKTVGVIGAGQMGSGIAHVVALGGYDVRLHDVSRVSATADVVVGRDPLDVRHVRSHVVRRGESSRNRAGG